MFYSFFKTLTNQEVIVELKNDVAIRGTLHSVDQYLNIKLHDIHVVDEEKHPHLLSVKNCFIRGYGMPYAIRHMCVRCRARSLTHERCSRLVARLYDTSTCHERAPI